ncbi:MAG: thiamine-phosphate kinase [Chlamydiota bacterium]|nr:thiamine-phosphate kinase [Chlamydiota bacterium]
MLIKEIGENRFIDWISKVVPVCKDVICGIGDDCAVLNMSRKGFEILYATDNLIENVHYLVQDQPKAIGRKSLARVLSDIAAMGGIPKYALLSMAIPMEMNIAYLESVVKGFLGLAKKYHVQLVGGDIARSPLGLNINVSILGEIEKGAGVFRSGARAGDKIYVTGRLGGSILGKHMSFVPRINESRWLHKRKIPNAMMDISDGLAVDLRRMMIASHTGAVIYERSIPVSRDAHAMEDKHKAIDHALYDGEDYELLFTTRKKQSLWFNSFKALFLTHITCVGEVTAGKRIFIESVSGEQYEINNMGYRHF